MENTAETVAIYWDFENLHASLVDQEHGAGTYESNRFRPQEEILQISTIIEFALSVGPIAINRAFANWVSFNRYKTQLLESAIAALWSNHPKPQPDAAPTMIFLSGALCEPGEPYTHPHDPPP